MLIFLNLETSNMHDYEHPCMKDVNVCMVLFNRIPCNRIVSIKKLIPLVTLVYPVRKVPLI